MKHDEFKKVVESLPSYPRLAFIHGERLFSRDECGYRIVYLQALYEMASRPVGMIVTSEKLSKQQREELLTDLSKELRNGLITDMDITAIGDGEPKSISFRFDPCIREVPPPKPPAPTSFAAGGLIPRHPSEDDHDDALTDGQVWVAIGIIILLILIISFSAFPNP